MSGRLARPLAGPEDARHGTVNGYKNLRCRCDRCKRANASDMSLTRRARSLYIAPDDPRHGSVSFYRNYGCRCESCKSARRADNRTAP